MALRPTANSACRERSPGANAFWVSPVGRCEVQDREV
jgi:hypothetical protein